MVIFDSKLCVYQRVPDMETKDLNPQGLMTPRDLNGSWNLCGEGQVHGRFGVTDKFQQVHVQGTSRHSLMVSPVFIYLFWGLIHSNISKPAAITRTPSIRRRSSSGSVQSRHISEKFPSLHHNPHPVNSFTERTSRWFHSAGSCYIMLHNWSQRC